MKSDGSEQRQLTKIGVSGHFLRWSRDGARVTFRWSCGGKPRRTRCRSAVTTLLRLNSEIVGGAHMSFSPDYSLLMDVVGHKTLWVSPVSTGKPVKVYGFPDGQVASTIPCGPPTASGCSSTVSARRAATSG